MKKLLVVAAAVMAAAPAAMASKARVQALNGSRQIVDIQNAFERPYQFMQLDSMATIEWGGDATAANRAEGGFLMRSEEQAYGIYLGHRQAEMNTVLTSGTHLGEQNPISLFYATKMGEWTFGGSLNYSTGKDDAANQKVSAMSVSLGAAMGAWEMELTQGISGKSEDGATDRESKGLTKVGVTYKLNETMQVYGKYMMNKFDVGAATTETTDMSVGFVNTVAATEDANIFYGVAYNNTETKNATKGSYLPVWIGLEANANSWLVVRGSVQQNVLLNETTDVAAGDNKSDLESIVFNAGLGAKLGKGILDATVSTANQGNLGFNDDLFGQVSYTFMF